MLARRGISNFPFDQKSTFVINHFMRGSFTSLTTIINLNIFRHGVYVCSSQRLRSENLTLHVIDGNHFSSLCLKTVFLMKKKAIKGEEGTWGQRRPYEELEDNWFMMKKMGNISIDKHQYKEYYWYLLLIMNERRSRFETVHVHR